MHQVWHTRRPPRTTGGICIRLSALSAGCGRSSAYGWTGIDDNAGAHTYVDVRPAAGKGVPTGNLVNMAAVAALMWASALEPLSSETV